MDKLTRLLERLGEKGSILVAYSGGVDSTLLAAAANEALGTRAVALTAVSPSLSARSRQQAEVNAAAIGIRHILIESHELDDPMYASNPRDRCYYCKKEKFAVCLRVAAELGLAVVADGTTADDQHDFRPGRQAAAQMGVWSPLAEMGFTKEEVRTLLKEWYRLPIWDRPASPCLSSRFPYGVGITQARLRMVEAVEDALHDVGIKECRARFHGEIVRIETRPEDMERLLACRDTITAAAHAAGFRYVTMDLEPFRSGRLNG